MDVGSPCPEDDDFFMPGQMLQKQKWPSTLIQQWWYYHWYICIQYMVPMYSICTCIYTLCTRICNVGACFDQLSWDIRIKGYLKDILEGYERISFWILMDIFLGYERISISYPLIFSVNPWTYPAVYLFISNHIPSYPQISIDIHRYPHRYPSTYSCISIYLSSDIHWHILCHLWDILWHPHWYPITYPSIPIYLSLWYPLHIRRYPSLYPAGYSTRIRLARHAPACSARKTILNQCPTSPLASHLLLQVPSFLVHHNSSTILGTQAGHNLPETQKIEFYSAWPAWIGDSDSIRNARKLFFATSFLCHDRRPRLFRNVTCQSNA